MPSLLTTEYLLGTVRGSFFGPGAMPVVVKCTPKEWEAMGGQCPDNLNVEELGRRTVGMEGLIQIYGERLRPRLELICRWRQASSGIPAISRRIQYRQEGLPKREEARTGQMECTGYGALEVGSGQGDPGARVYQGRQPLGSIRPENEGGERDLPKVA